MKSELLREKFLAFFKARKHKVVESDSLVPKDDPTVLFTPAGMNQFKSEFMGAASDLERAATSQRCLRTDDLDKVGITRGHHTFFEMLGNFSFGDYFKEEAVAWAWEFLTQELKISKDKLWVSVYKDDAEAYRIWKDKIGIPEKKIIKLGDKENFWPSEAKEKGPNGPCGPCSEIFFDLGDSAGCGKELCDPGCGCGRFLEVWNLVFTQFNRKEGGALEPLPQKNIDTGMGLERLAAVMQGVPNNFETDLFKPLITEIMSKCPAIKESAGVGVSEKKELFYAVADHIRAIVFSIYDGVLPSNEARGYVVRKLIRKSTLHLRALGFKNPFLYKLVPVASQIMKRPYPELDSRKENIAQIILAEEKSFINTLDSSNALMRDKFGSSCGLTPLKAGVIAFQLYDTHGIPLELTLDWVEKHKIKISRAAFDKELKEQKSRSKAQSAMKGDVFAIKEFNLGSKATTFLGYNRLQVKAKVLKIIHDNSPAKNISKGQAASIILDKTAFYAQSGGQVGDSGELIKGKNIFSVQDTKSFDKVVVHIGEVKEGNFKVGDELKACVAKQRRLSIARNHTATHLLQAALRKVLGAHVKQQGSLVAEERLRFDFTHFKDLSAEDLERVEEIVNDYILGNLDLSSKQMTLAQAKKSGALAFFGEKYGDKVRVVSIGEASREFCGGTHLESSAQIGLFKILQELSVASGIRRIEAVTGSFAYKKVKGEEAALAEASRILSVPVERLAQELQKRLSLVKELEKQAYAQKLESASGSIDELLKNAQEIGGMKVIVKSYENTEMNILRKTVDLVKSKTDNAIVALAGTRENRVSLVVGITQDLCDKGIDAARIVREIAPLLGGSGGGRKDFAQAGGMRPENIQQAFEKLKEVISRIKS